MGIMDAPFELREIVLCFSYLLVMKYSTKNARK